MTVEITTATGEEMLQSVTPIYSNDEQALAIFEANGKVMDEVAVVIEGLKTEIYPQNATWTLGYWEQMLGIKTNKNLLSSERVQKVLFELNKYFPVTRMHMETMVNRFVPSETAEVIETPYEYSFRVNIPLEDLVDYNSLKDMVEEIKPAHLQALYYFTARENIQREINNIVQMLLRMSFVSNPWAQAGIGSAGEIIHLDGEYLLNGDRFLNGFYKKDGPDHLQRISLVMKVLHGFGVHEVNLMPSLDGEFSLNGEISLQHEPQNVRLVTLHDAKTRYKKRESVHVVCSQTVPVICSTRTMHGVVPLNGQVQLDSSISLDQALSNHSGFFRVKKAGSIIEEVAI